MQENETIVGIYGKTESHWLKAEDIPDGQRPIATIESVSLQTQDYGQGQGLQTQIILKFVGIEKKLGVSKTNAEQLFALLGPVGPVGKDPNGNPVALNGFGDPWLGRRIQLKTEWLAGLKKNAIRICDFLPDAVPAQTNQQPIQQQQVFQQSPQATSTAPITAASIAASNDPVPWG